MVRLYLNHYKIKPQSGSKYCRQIVTAATLLLYSWPNDANATPSLMRKFRVILVLTVSTPDYVRSKLLFRH